MKVLPLSLIWCILFVCACFTFGSLNLLFWISIVGFSLCCVYAEKNKSRLMNEIDELFGSDNFF